MRFIFKNYLKTFIKNWIQTIGTILFIMMMVTIVIGMLSAPLQISSIVNGYKARNNSYNTFLIFDSGAKQGDFSNKFLYDYVYQNQDFSGKNENDQQITILPKNNGPILSKAYKISLDRYINSTGATSVTEKQSFVGGDLKNALNAYKQGGLIPLNLGLVITNDQGEVDQANLNLVIDNLAALLAKDATLAINQNYGETYTSPEVMFRLIMKMLTLAINNSLNLDLNKLSNEIGSGSGIGSGIVIKNEQQMEIAAKTMLNKVFEMALTDEKQKSLTWKFSTFELFDPKIYWSLAWKEKANSSEQTYEDYSYDFNYYVLNKIFNNPENPNFYDKKRGFRYQINDEKSLFFAQNTTDSLFPKFAIELRTVNQNNALNQLQLERGNRPGPIRFRDLVNKDRERAEIPTIVISSAYLEANNYKFEDILELPESSAKNNLLLPTRQPIASFLTGTIPFQIVGTGSKFDDLVPGKHFIPFLESIDSYANGYVNNNLFSTIRNARWNFTSTNQEDFQTKFMFKNRWSKNDQVVDQLTINRFNGTSVYNVNSLISFNDSKTNKNLALLQVIVTIFIILGVVVLILSFVFINFIIKKELNETRKQIGIFKSFGYKISELSWIFAVKTLITIFAGIVLGIVMSMPLQLYAIRLYIDSIMFRFSHIYVDPGFLSILLIAIPIVFLLVSYFSTLQYLREPTLSLLSNGAKISKWTVKPSLLLRRLSEKNKWFSYRLQRAFIRRSMGKFVVVQTLFAFSSLSYTLMFGAQTLLYALVTQGFSSLNPKTDHEFGWWNKSTLNISINDTKFNVDNIQDYVDQNFEYIGYNDTDGIGDAIKNDKQSSDSRYRISLVIDSYAREFDTNRRDNALNLMMPLDYYVDRYVYQQGKNPEHLGKNAIKFTKDDYYLNWFFTLKISDFPLDMVENVMNNKPYNFSQIESYVNIHPDIRLDLSKVLTDDGDPDPDAIAELTKQLPKTIIGMRTLDANGLKNNLFLDDITKMIILQLAEQNFDAQIDKWLNQNAIPVGNGWYNQSDVERAIREVKNSELGQNFDPRDPHYWGLMDNPLIDLSSIMGGDDELDNPIAGVPGFSLSKLPKETVSLIMSALMLQKDTTNDINQNPVITMNQLFFNRDKEFLINELWMAIDNINSSGQQNNTDWVTLRMFDTQSNDYGNYANLLSRGGIDQKVFDRLAQPLADDHTINGIVPYGLAKTYNIKVNDTFNLLTDTVHREQIKIKVIGINEDISFKLGSAWPIDIDYGQFRAKFFNPELNYLYEANLPYFNKMFSQEPLLTGNIDINDISGSINTMKFVGKNLSMSMDNDAAIFGTVFNGMVDVARFFNIPVDNDFILLTNPNIASGSKKSSVVPYNILRIGVNGVIDIVNNVLVLFMILLAFLLLIILVVVMNIVVEEASEIILTLRAIGYSNWEVNWIVMGSYIIGALASFVVAYIMSIVIWLVFLDVVGKLAHIYVFMRFSWQAPVITFIIIGTILVIGWFAANMRVNKTPLSRITSFG